MSIMSSLKQNLMDLTQQPFPTTAVHHAHPGRHPGPCPAGVASSAAWQPAQQQGHRKGVQDGSGVDSLTHIPHLSHLHPTLEHSPLRSRAT